MPGIRVMSATALAIMVAAAGAKAAQLPQCDASDAAFPQPGRQGATGRNAFRSLPDLAPAASSGAGTLALGLQLLRVGPDGPGPDTAAWVGNYLVSDLPAFRTTPAVGMRVSLPGLAPPPAACLTDPRWIYGGAHWRLRQGDTIQERLTSVLDLPGPASHPVPVAPPANGGVPCRATNTHTHGLLVRPSHPARQPHAPPAAAGPYGDYVLDTTVPEPGDVMADGCGTLLGHAHGVLPNPLSYDIAIPGAPGVNSMQSGQHPSGLFWYHPHPHGYSRPQVSGGTTGVITVGSLADYACTVPRVGGKCPSGGIPREPRILELKDIQIEQAGAGWRPLAKYDASTDNGVCGPRDPATHQPAPARGGECGPGAVPGRKWVFTVNGAQYPNIAVAKSGDDEIWAVANASANMTYDLVLAGPSGTVQFQVLALDGVAIPQSPGAVPGTGPSSSTTGVYTTDRILMMPGTRVELRVPPQPSGEYVLRSLETWTGAGAGASGNGDTWPEADLLTVTWPTPLPQRPGTQPFALSLASAAALHVEGLRSLPAPPAPPHALSLPVTPEACILHTGDERRIYMVHRTVGNREVFGLLAGIQRHGGALEFYAHVPPQGGQPETWTKAAATDAATLWAQQTIPGAPDPDFFPAYGHNPYGDICTTHGSRERWRIENLTNENHNFHLHQSRFRLDDEHMKQRDPQHWTDYFQFPAADNTPAGRSDTLIAAMANQSEQPGQPSWADAYHDSVPVPRGSGGSCNGEPGGCPLPGRMTILVDFLRQEQVGDFVYHCHILEHEDGGMMANVSVKP